MRRMLTVGVLLAVGARGQSPEADVWDKLVASNNLVGEGKTPFHLEIKFQLYDMDGKPTRSGTVEDWWRAPGLERVIVHLEGVNEDGSLAAGASHELVRDRYLVNELLSLAVHPVREDPTIKKVKRETQTFGKVRLDCFRPAVGDAAQCVEPQTETVLMRRNDQEAASRQSTGMFHDTHVALKLELAFLGRMAITGEVTRLQHFDVGEPGVELRTLSVEQESMPEGPMHTAYPKGVVISGKSTATVEPQLPAGVREGKVTVSLVVGREGNVLDVAPIACSDAAMCAVAARTLQQWKYAPALLDGQRIEVSLTVALDVKSDRF